ncbi:MAG: hypothetical protein GY778_03555 [bacterium]|nr:hypothetical protein [bacterium]
MAAARSKMRRFLDDPGAAVGSALSRRPALPLSRWCRRSAARDPVRQRPSPALDHGDAGWRLFARRFLSDTQIQPGGMPHAGVGMVDAS